MSQKLQPSNPTSTKSWRRINIKTPSSLTEIVGTFLCDLTGHGIELTDNREGEETITAYLPESTDTRTLLLQIEEFLDRLRQNLPHGQELEISYSSLPEEDWNLNWKKHFKPEHITRRLVIKPTWEYYSAAAEEKIIEMDPGMAFGTGHHASTRLCTRFIDLLLQNPHPPTTVLDVGTGTGILAMAAVLLGAQSAYAIDNDPEAVKVAAENILRNKLADRITASGLDLRNLTGRFDLVIANIIHDTLIELAPYIIDRLNPDGHLILAGILAGEQEINITRTYSALGLKHLATEQEDEWVALLFILSKG